jgi:hypothetical protein
LDKPGEGDGHCRHRGAAVIDTQHGTAATGMLAGDLFGRDIDRHSRATRSDIDARNKDTGRGDRIGQKGEFLTLGVGGAHHIDALHCVSPVLAALGVAARRSSLPGRSVVRGLAIF